MLKIDSNPTAGDRKEGGERKKEKMEVKVYFYYRNWIEWFLHNKFIINL